jgi:hypothetical protein
MNEIFKEVLEDMNKFGITTDSPYHPIHDAVYSEIRGENVHISEVQKYCSGCESPMIEDDLESGNSVFLNCGDIYCHSDCLRDSR